MSRHVYRIILTIIKVLFLEHLISFVHLLNQKNAGNTILKGVKYQKNNRKKSDKEQLPKNGLKYVVNTMYGLLNFNRSIKVPLSRTSGENSKHFDDLK